METTSTPISKTQAFAVVLPYALIHLLVICFSVIYLRMNRESPWIDFSLAAYPIVLVTNGVISFLLRESRNAIFKATNLAFFLMLLCFLPFLGFILFF